MAPARGHLAVGELRHRLAAEAQGIRATPSAMAARVLAQLLLRGQERQGEVGRTPDLLGGRDQQLPRVDPLRQMDGSAPHDETESLPGGDTVRRASSPD